MQYLFEVFCFAKVSNIWGLSRPFANDAPYWADASKRIPDSMRHIKPVAQMPPGKHLVTDAAWLWWSDENRCAQHDMAVTVQNFIKWITWFLSDCSFPCLILTKSSQISDQNKSLACSLEELIEMEIFALAGNSN